MVLALILGLGSEACAHAILMASSPAAGEALASPPAGISLRFNEPVQVIALRIIDAAGHDVALGGAPAAVDGTVRIATAGALAEGRYLVSWRVGSLDGHVIGGSFAFSVGTLESTAPLDMTTREEVWLWPSLALRALTRLLSLFVLGIALFRIWIAPPHLAAALAPVIRRLAIAALASLLVSLGADGAMRADLPLAGILARDAWDAAVNAPAAWLHGLSAIGLMLLAVSSQRPAQMVGALLSLASVAGAGHVLAVLPAGCGEALMLLHGLTGALWAGAIWPLRRALAMEAGLQTVDVFNRFQTLALFAVLGVVGSGVAMTWLVLPRVSDLWLSDYGLRLCLKLAAVGVMLGIAVLNRAYLTRRAMANSYEARKLLRLVLGLDVIAAALAIVFAVGLSLGPPPTRALELALSNDRYAIEATLAPGRIGDNDIEIILQPRAGAPAEPREVELRIGAPAAGIEPATHRARRIGPAHYQITDLPLWIAGPWEIRLGILVDDFTKVQAEAEVALPR